MYVVPARSLVPEELLAIAQAFYRLEQRKGRRLVVLTSGGAGLAENESPCDMAPYIAALKVIAQELSDLTCQSIDLSARWIEQPAELAALWAELAQTNPDRFVALRGHRRWRQQFAPLRLAHEQNSPRKLREDGTYLITGGLGKVGLHLADLLTRKYGARLILSSRHAVDPAAAPHASALGRLHASGAELLVRKADVSDRASMTSLLSEGNRRFGRIDGVLHAAGITSGDSIRKLIPQLTPEHFEEQFTPKVTGTLLLDELLRDMELDFILLFSSNASVLGGLGLMAYSAACAFLDAFAEYKWRVGDRRWISATWDGWRVTEEVKAGAQTSLDRYAMRPEESIDAFERIVTATPVPVTIVSSGDFGERARLWLEGTPETPSADEAAPETAKRHDRSALSSAYVAPRDNVERAITLIWEDILGISGIGVNDVFFDLGGHSLFANRMVSRINEKLGVEFPLFKLFESPTVSGVTAIVRELKPANTIPQTKRVKTQTLSQLMAKAQKK